MNAYKCESSDQEPYLLLWSLNSKVNARSDTQYAIYLVNIKAAVTRYERAT